MNSATIYLENFGLTYVEYEPLPGNDCNLEAAVWLHPDGRQIDVFDVLTEAESREIKSQLLELAKAEHESCEAMIDARAESDYERRQEKLHMEKFS